MIDAVIAVESPIPKATSIPISISVSSPIFDFKKVVAAFPIGVIPSRSKDTILGINTIEEANKYLLEVFVPNFNERFAMNYKKFESVFEEAPSIDKINYTLAILTPRKIDNGNSIKFQNKYYQPYLNNRLKCFMPKTDCLVIKAYDGSLVVSIDEQILELKELSRNERFSKNFEEEKTTKERQKYIPPMSHPFKAASFKKYQEKQAARSHIGFGKYCYN